MATEYHHGVLSGPGPNALYLLADHPAGCLQRLGCWLQMTKSGDLLVHRVQSLPVQSEPLTAHLVLEMVVGARFSSDAALTAPDFKEEGDVLDQEQLQAFLASTSPVERFSGDTMESAAPGTTQDRWESASPSCNPTAAESDLAGLGFCGRGP